MTKLCLCFGLELHVPSSFRRRVTMAAQSFTHRNKSFWWINLLLLQHFSNFNKHFGAQWILFISQPTQNNVNSSLQLIYKLLSFTISALLLPMQKMKWKIKCVGGLFCGCAQSFTKSLLGTVFVQYFLHKENKHFLHFRMYQSDLLIFIEALEITSVVVNCIRHERSTYHWSLFKVR